MSREQGPREAGMRPAAIGPGRRRHAVSLCFILTAASGMVRGAHDRRGRSRGPTQWGCERPRMPPTADNKEP